MPLLMACPIAEKTWHQEANAPNGIGAKGGVQTFAKGADSWQPIIQQIAKFQDLGDGWDGLEATAPSRELVDSAIGLARLLAAKGMAAPCRVAPGLMGSVLMEWQDANGSYTEVEIVRPFFADVMLIEPGKPAQHWTLPTQ
ncbi:MAG TPA: hypothetical protein VE988_03745 [Gemmataceae bacterium]|nr:hypothetical protein [Gemmataceae bacterium]